MPHISKINLQLKDMEKLQNEFLRSLERSAKNRAMGKVLNEFFTRTEKVMFAKRLAIIAMLSRDVSWNAIADILNVSPSTVERMALGHEKRKYNDVIKYALGKKDIWDILQAIITVGGVMPARVGRGRHNALNKLVYDENLKNS